MEEKLLRIKVSTEQLLCRIRYFCTASAFSEELHFEKATFHSYTSIYQSVIKSAQFELRTLKLWEFYLKYLSLLKVASKTKFI